MTASRMRYDREADAAYICVAEGSPVGGVARTVSVDPWDIGGMVTLDLDHEGRIVGIEVMDASSKLSRELLRAE